MSYVASAITDDRKSQQFPVDPNTQGGLHQRVNASAPGVGEQYVAAPGALPPMGYSDARVGSPMNRIAPMPMLFTAEQSALIRNTYYTSHKALNRALPYANPGILGLAAFASSTFLLSALNTGWISGQAAAIVLPLAFWFGGLGQLVAGMWEFYVGNTWGGTTLSSYGLFYFAYGTIGYYIVPTWLLGGISTVDQGKAQAVFTLAFTILTLLFMIVSFFVNRILSVMFILLLTDFILATVAYWINSVHLLKASGYIGVVFAAVGWYLFSSVLFNSVLGREVLYVGHIKHPSAGSVIEHQLAFPGGRGSLSVNQNQNANVNQNYNK